MQSCTPLSQEYYGVEGHPPTGTFDMGERQHNAGWWAYVHSVRGIANPSCGRDTVTGVVLVVRLDDFVGALHQTLMEMNPLRWQSL